MTSLAQERRLDPELTWPPFPPSRPHSTDSATHRKMTLSLADRCSKTQKIRILPMAGRDPESHRNEMIKVRSRLQEQRVETCSCVGHLDTVQTSSRRGSTLFSCCRFHSNRCVATCRKANSSALLIHNPCCGVSPMLWRHGCS